MRPKIVIISSHYLHAPVKEAMERLKLDCDLVLTTYDNFMHIPSVYDKYAEEADGFPRVSAVRHRCGDVRRCLRRQLYFL